MRGVLYVLGDTSARTATGARGLLHGRAPGVREELGHEWYQRTHPLCLFTTNRILPIGISERATSPPREALGQWGSRQPLPELSWEAGFKEGSALTRWRAVSPPPQSSICPDEGAGPG